MIGPAFHVDHEALAALCRRHGIRRLAVFGSVLDRRAGPGNDIDLLVEFRPETTVGLRFITIQDELTQLFGRTVDLNTPAFLSRHFRDRVLQEARPIYQAA